MYSRLEFSAYNKKRIRSVVIFSYNSHQTTTKSRYLLFNGISSLQRPSLHKTGILCCKRNITLSRDTCFIIVDGWTCDSIALCCHYIITCITRLRRETWQINALSNTARTGAIFSFLGGVGKSYNFRFSNNFTIWADILQAANYMNYTWGQKFFRNKTNYQVTEMQLNAGNDSALTTVKARPHT